MPYSYIETTASAGQTLVSTPPYLQKTHIAVSVNSVDVEYATLVWNTDSQIQLPEAMVGGETIKVYRTTPASTPLVTFGPGAITHSDLNRSILHSLYVIQEAYDLALISADVLALAQAEADAAAEDAAAAAQHLADIVASINTEVTGTFVAGLSFTPSFTGAVARTVRSVFEAGIDAEAFGAVGTVHAGPLVDETAALQAAIDYAESVGGANVLLKPGRSYKGNVILKTGVMLVGQPGNYGYLGSTPAHRTRLVGAVAGAVIDTPATPILNCGVYGLNIQGLGAATAGQGIRFRDVDRGMIREVHISNVSDEGILIDDGFVCGIVDVLIMNALLNRTRASDVGALSLGGTDHWVTHAEVTISGSLEGTVQSASLFCNAILVAGGNNFLTDCVGEISDVGFKVSGDKNRFTACRGDLNYGHGFLVTGVSNIFTGCYGLNNSQDTTNTYDNFQTTVAGNNLFTGCLADTTGVAKAVRYGFNDTPGSATNKNRYVGCLSTNAATQNHISNNSNGGSFLFPNNGPILLTANLATPSVDGNTIFHTANTLATTITNFLNGVTGQRIVIWCNDNNTTIQHNGSTFVLANSGNLKLRSGYTYEFVRRSGAWLQVGAFADPHAVTADVGDAAITLSNRQSNPTQIWNTPLTAHRHVTLNGSGGISGKFRIVRTAACTGAFTLSVGTGPLHSMASPGMWCDVEYDGAAWVLTATGTL